MVEHSAVNRVVAGSSPARGVKPAAGAAAEWYTFNKNRFIHHSVMNKTIFKC